MRALRVVAILVAVGALAGCAGGSDDDGNGAAETTATQTAVGTTPQDVRVMVFERSYSECATSSLQELGGKYRAKPQPRPVALAVARAWVENLRAGPDAIPSGRDGCLQALRES